MLDFNPRIEKTDKGLVISFDYLQRLNDSEIAPFHSDYPTYIDFLSLHKWPNLKQTGYKLFFNLRQCKTISSKKSIHSFNSLQADKTEGIYVQFDGKRKQRLVDYFNSKVSNLDLFEFALNKGNHSLGGRYSFLGSSKVSQVLSSQGICLIPLPDSIKGHKTIFESDELLDQLFIYVLIWYTKFGSQKAYDVLSALLWDRIVSQTKKSFIGEKYDDDFINDMCIEARTLLLKIIKEEDVITSYLFDISKGYSLRAWFVGNSGGSGRFHPVIKQYFRGKRNKEERLDTISIEGGGLDGIIGDNREDKIDRKNFIKSARKVLSKKEFGVLEKRLSGFTMEEIGESLSVSESRVSQIWKEIRTKLEKLKF